MTDFHVDLEDLSRATQDMTDFELWWEKTVLQLDKLIDALHIDWTGEAADAHKQAHLRWSEGARKMREALGELKTSGRQAHHNYLAAGHTGLHMWDIP